MHSSHAIIAATLRVPPSPQCRAAPTPQVLQDPAIKEMAENIARDPAFAQMTAALQQSMGPGAPGVPGGAGAAAGPAAAAAAAFDPSQYMEAMSGVLQNPAFMQMAEQLGSKIMQVTRLPSAVLAISSHQSQHPWTLCYPVVVAGCSSHGRLPSYSA